ncbi:MAG: hypothetical protein IJF73_00630 [Clostridia bacterium]|nr:hypothetical protein [Clostridia bacterium]
MKRMTMSAHFDHMRGEGSRRRKELKEQSAIATRNDYAAGQGSRQKKEHRQRRCAFFNEIRLRRVKFGFAK